jgi:hypothetical protein
MAAAALLQSGERSEEKNEMARVLGKQPAAAVFDPPRSALGRPIASDSQDSSGEFRPRRDHAVRRIPGPGPGCGLGAGVLVRASEASVGPVLLGHFVMPQAGPLGCTAVAPRWAKGNIGPKWSNTNKWLLLKFVNFQKH